MPSGQEPFRQPNTGVTFEGIAQAIRALSYRSERSPKYRLVDALRRAHKAGDGRGMGNDDLIRILWGTEGHCAALISRRRNLSSLRSSVNADLMALYRKGDNPEGLIIGRDNAFAICDEAKDQALEALRSLAGMGDGAPDLTRIGSVLQDIRAMLEGAKEGGGSETSGVTNAEEALRQTIRELAVQVGVRVIEGPAGAGHAGPGGQAGPGHGMPGEKGEQGGPADGSAGEVDPVDDAVLKEVDEEEPDLEEEVEDELIEVVEVEADEDEEAFEGAGSAGEVDPVDDIVLKEVDEEEPNLEEEVEDELIEVVEGEADEDEEAFEGAGSAGDRGLTGADGEDAEDDAWRDEALDGVLDGWDGMDAEWTQGTVAPARAEILAEEFNRSLAAMDRFYNQYILVPGGSYPMGSGSKASRVHVEAFYVGKFPVTNALFEVFVEKTGYRTTAERSGYGTVYQGRFRRETDESNEREHFYISSGMVCTRVAEACWYQPEGPGSSLRNRRNHPVVQVTLEDAMAFAAWSGKRLPTEEEWEAAMRTGEGRDFPWGDVWQRGACNVEESCIGGTTSVDQYEVFANPLGVADGLGNVMEWTLSCEEGARAARRVARGASWIAGSGVTLSRGTVIDRGDCSNVLGFRCVAV